jgi:hypothetical protein
MLNVGKYLKLASDLFHFELLKTYDHQTTDPTNIRSTKLI